MKLYYYEHCPYCIRVLMLVYYKNIQLEHIVLANDDEETPIKMINQKMLPILEKDDGSFLPESLDIIDYLDNLDTPILGNNNALGSEILAIIDKMTPAYIKLVLPRMPQSIFKEFQTESARKYFTKKKELMTGPFEDCIKQTDELITEITPHLEALSNHLSLNENDFTYQDIHLYPRIYLLHLVDSLHFPDKMQRYFDLKNKQMDASHEKLKLFD